MWRGIRLGLSKWEAAEIAASEWRPPPLPATSRLVRRGGLRVRLLIRMVLLLAMIPSYFLLQWWMERWIERTEPWSGAVVFALLAGTMVVCIVGIEVVRRRRIRILPGPGRD